MSTAERIIKKKSKYKAEMDKLLPKVQSDALWQKATAMLDELLARYSDLPKGVHIHTDSKIFPAAAIYLTVKDAVGQETAYKMIEDSAIQGCADIEKKLAKLMKLPGMNSLFVKVWDPMTKRVFGAENDFQNVFYPKKKDEYRMDIVMDVPLSTNRMLFASEKARPAQLLEEGLQKLPEGELKALLQHTQRELTPYSSGGKCLTDEKAPVELLGMRMIDEIIGEELQYYKGIYRREGLQGVLNMILGPA